MKLTDALKTIPVNLLRPDLEAKRVELAKLTDVNIYFYVGGIAQKSYDIEELDGCAFICGLKDKSGPVKELHAYKGIVSPVEPVVRVVVSR